MSPLRIVILAVLVYLGYRLLFDRRRQEQQQPGKAQNADTGMPVSDILVEDPICHCLVPKRQAIHLRHQGEMVYFCSEECCSRFLSQEGEEK